MIKEVDNKDATHPKRRIVIEIILLSGPEPSASPAVGRPGPCSCISHYIMDRLAFLKGAITSKK